MRKIPEDLLLFEEKCNPKKKEKLKKYYYKEYQKEYQKKYGKKYYLNNRDKLREQHKKYDQDNKEKISKRKKEYRERNKEEMSECQKEKILKHQKEYYKKNKEKFSKRSKEWRQKNKEKNNQSIKEWRKKNIKRVKKNEKKWRKKDYQENREKYKEKKNKYNKKYSLLYPRKNWALRSLGHHKCKGNIIKITKEYLIEKAKNTKYCEYCGVELNWDNNTKNGRPQNNSPTLERVDNENIITVDNIKIVCRQCNFTKNDKTFKEFIKYCHLIANKFPLGK